MPGALLAGGNWGNGANCGSRCRNANNSRLNVNANNGCQGQARIRIDDVLNVEILITAYRLKESKYQRTSAPDCLTIQFEYPDKPGVRHVIFTGSTVLCDQLKRYQDNLPFLATIKRIDRYFTLT